MERHGNGGSSNEVYAAVSPKIAFADCPNRLRDNINPSTGKAMLWNTPERIAFVESLGAKVLTFGYASHTIELY